MSDPVLHSEFLAEFGAPPALFARAPGRVNLIGEHVDYSGGFVLPIAIDRDVRMMARLLPWPEFDIASVNYGERVRWNLAEACPFEPGSWPSYFAAVLHQFQDRGIRLPGLQVLVSGSVPQGAALSSSAACEVCAATLLNAATNAGLEPPEIAVLAQAAENSPLVGVQCGIMDQFASACAQEGSALMLDCFDLSHRQVPFPEGVVVAIVNSMKRRALVGSEYNDRRRDCEEALAILRRGSGRSLPSLRHVTADVLARHGSTLTPRQLMRARHAVGENRRTVEFADALVAGKLDRAGKLLYQSHASLRDDYEVSCRELDLIVEIASRIDGVHGCRMTGGGFGGCAVALMKPSAVDEFDTTMKAKYGAVTEVEPEIYFVSPAGGASSSRLLVLSQK